MTALAMYKIMILEISHCAIDVGTLHLNGYFLSIEDFQKYGQPDTNVICWVPLITIQKKKKETQYRKKVYEMPMTKGIVDRATTYAIETTIKKQLSQH